MKIAWFTPYSRHSAIAHVSREVTSRLGASTEVDLWIQETADLLETDLRTVRYSAAAEVEPEVLRQYDLVVYNLGDSLHHREIFEVSRMVPGAVILHDQVMHHFFAQHLVLELGRPEDYVSLVRRHCGSAGEALAREAIADNRVWHDSSRVAQFPLFEPAIEDARGVVVHSAEQCEVVAAAYSGPVTRLRLPWHEDPRDRTGPPVGPSVRPGRLLMLTTGHVNDNRRIPVVLRALASSPLLRGVLAYAIAGPVTEAFRKQLNALVVELGLRESVKILGRVSDAELHAWLRRSDLCVNLRWPVMEGASASVVEQMMYGKPIVVTDAGFYREISADCALKVDPGSQVQGLTRALTRLSGSAALRQRLGERARQWAVRELSPQGYADGFRDFAEDLVVLRPVHSLMRRISGHLRELGVGTEDPIVERVASEAYRVFCAAPGVPRNLRAKAGADSESDRAGSRRPPGPNVDPDGER